MGAPAEFLWGEVDVFSERFANPLIDGVFHKNTIFVFGGVGGTGEVAGETGSGEPGEASKTVIKEAASADFFKVGLRHRINLCFGSIRSRIKGIR